ncbi:MAG: DUF1922 domain-containing protein [Methanoregulaceae archaeon]|nr:DUF1922 domain-containing protein [Methanoregulaceae archaeon]
MYLVIRCGGCRVFTYVDCFQEWKLCPVCGEAIEVGKSPVYLEVEDYHVADRVIQQLEKYLHTERKKDLSDEELSQLRLQYAEWVREQGQES